MADQLKNRPDIVSGRFCDSGSSQLHFIQFSSGKHNSQNKGCRICNGARVHNAVDSHKIGQDDNQRQKENKLSGKGHDDAQLCFAYGCKEACGHGLYAIGKGKKHKNPEIAFCKLEIKVASCSEQSHDLMWKNLETEKKYSGNNGAGNNRIPIGFSDPIILFGAVIKAPDRLASLGNTDTDG